MDRRAWSGPVFSRKLSKLRVIFSVTPLIIPGFLTSFTNFPLTLNSVWSLMRPKSRESVLGFVRIALHSKMEEKETKKKLEKTAVKVANESRKGKKMVLRCCD